MSDTPPQNPQSGDERERILAAEYSLGLLESEELLAARGRMAVDPEFAFRKEWWDDWFVPLSDDVAGAEPGAHVWTAIANEVREIETQGSGATVTTLDMERKVRRWQVTAALTSAAAVVLAFFAVGPFNASPSGPPTSEGTNLVATSAPALMASIPIGDTPLRLNVTFLPSTDEMLVSAAGLAADGIHDHELWLVPADGSDAQSLGVVAPGEERRVALAREVATNMDDGVQLVLTREPIGGKPDGVDAGSVVAQGALSAV